VRVKSEKAIEREKDREFTLKVFERDNLRCAICGKERITPHTLHSMHIFPREYKKTRWDINNGITGCARCHIFAQHSFHQNPLFFVFWLKKFRPQQYEYMMELLPQFITDSNLDSKLIL